MRDIIEFITDKYLNIKEVEDSFEKLKKEITTQIELINSITNAKSLETFLKLRFSRDFNFNGKKENISEFLNQASTTLVTLKALDYLFKKYGNTYKYVTALSTSSGYDITGINEIGDVKIVAEVFSVVSKKNNSKLSKDKKKLLNSDSKSISKYLFFYSYSDEINSDENEYEKDGIFVVQFPGIFKMEKQ